MLSRGKRDYIQNTHAIEQQLKASERSAVKRMQMSSWFEKSKMETAPAAISMENVPIAVTSVLSIELGVKYVVSMEQTLVSDSRSLIFEISIFGQK
jgi:hypothetical protein